MSLGLSWALIGLVALPVLLTAYVWQLRRRRSTVVRHSNVALVRAAAGPVRRWRRHVPIALVLASLALLGLAGARPQVEADVPVSSSTIIVALDVSGSMCATDVNPNRLSAAQAAVRAFVEGQDEETKVGLVLFSGFAQLAVAPTTNRDDVLTTLAEVTTGRGTTIGAAILTSIDAIAEIDPNVARSDPVGAPGPSSSATARPARPAGFAPEIVVLLTDGANTRGVTPAQAAEQAAARGVRVYPIGFGTKSPTQMVCSPDQMGAFGTGGFPGRREPVGRFTDPSGRNYLVVDDAALKQVAEVTRAEYFAATDAAQLARVLRDLPQHVTVQQRQVDVSAAFAAIAALMLVAGLGLSIRWSTLS